MRVRPHTRTHTIHLLRYLTQHLAITFLFFVYVGRRSNSTRGRVLCVAYSLLVAVSYEATAVTVLFPLLSASTTLYLFSKNHDNMLHLTRSSSNRLDDRAKRSLSIYRRVCVNHCFLFLFFFICFSNLRKTCKREMRVKFCCFLHFRSGRIGEEHYRQTDEDIAREWFH